MSAMAGAVRPAVVVVGAGFAGLWVARHLSAAAVDVVLVDRNNYHTFFPLLYQVAAAEIEPEQIAYPVRGIFRRRGNVGFVMAEVEGVDFAHRQVDLGERRLDYDYLVLAVGSVSRFFGTPGAAAHAFELKTLEQGIGLRNHILGRFEYAASVRDPAARRRALAFTVVGGGPTGVEFAGALAELVAGTLAQDYPTLNLADVRIMVLEAGDGLLAGFPEELRAYAANKLAELGVGVRLGARVAAVTADTVTLAGGETLATETVVWTAGVKGSPLATALGLPTFPDGRVRAEPTLQVPGHPEIFVAGDLCGVEQAGRLLPQIAPVAIQQGRHVARNILRHKAGRPLKPFGYRDKGTMATIGRTSAVVRLWGRAFKGFGAWTLWLFVHLLYLVGFRNRLFVLVNWSWDYFFFERGVRLILPRVPREEKKPGQERTEP